MTQVQHKLAMSNKGSRHHNKVIVALLAAVLGVFSVHWWYLRRRWAWAMTLATLVLIALTQLYPVWWDNPAFFLLIVPAMVGFIEALIFSLKTDEWFDRKYNRASGKTTKTGWAPVFIAVITTMVGSSALLFIIALTVLHVYKALGWLDSYVI